jgi:hypothetical protein
MVAGVCIDAWASCRKNKFDDAPNAVSNLEVFFGELYGDVLK